MTQRVWITGVGAATPLGHQFTTFAENLLAGKSGVAAQGLLPNDLGGRQNIAAVGQIPVPPGWDEAGFSRFNRMEQLTLELHRPGPAGRRFGDRTRRLADRYRPGTGR